MDDFIFRKSGGFHLLKNCILSLPFRTKSIYNSRLQSLQTHQTPVMKIEKLHHQTEWTSNTCSCTFSSLIEKRNRHTIISRSLPSCTRQSRRKDSNGWESANFELKIKWRENNFYYNVMSLKWGQLLVFHASRTTRMRVD